MFPSDCSEIWIRKRTWLNACRSCLRSWNWIAMDQNGTFTNPCQMKHQTKHSPKANVCLQRSLCFYDYLPSMCESVLLVWLIASVLPTLAIPIHVLDVKPPPKRSWSVMLQYVAIIELENSWTQHLSTIIFGGCCPKAHPHVATQCGHLSSRSSATCGHHPSAHMSSPLPHDRPHQLFWRQRPSQDSSWPQWWLTSPSQVGHIMSHRIHVCYIW